jgi:uncharacterized cupin superfamily protein
VTGEAPLEAVDSGLAPVGPGWFVVDVRDAAWLLSDAFGARCVFEGDTPVLRSRPELGVHRFPQLGIALCVLQPGQPSGLYHAESNQEDFLVLAGECLLLIEDTERPLAPGDFVHRPPGTAHAFVGAGGGPCAILMVGARSEGKRTVYPSSDLARAHGAGVEAETSSPAEAYAPYSHWRLGRPDELPWPTSSTT